MCSVAALHFVLRWSGNAHEFALAYKHLGGDLLPNPSPASALVKRENLNPLPPLLKNLRHSKLNCNLHFMRQ